MERNLVKKSIVAGIIFLFIGAGVIPSINGNIEPSNDENDAELPIWKVGDSWTYNMEMEGGYDPDIDFDSSIDNLKLDVTEVQDDRYKLDLTAPTGDVTGSGSVDLDIMTLQGNLINTEMNGIMYIDKSTLEIIESEMGIDGYIDKMIDIHFTVDFIGC